MMGPGVSPWSRSAEGGRET
ncbi:rCG52275 [Rattus norvegicus]|uniref:RCG52275 n=1 Tax=Rattus norvegicus TaxID=10116 RepID=A6K0P8_RAT|nr:rCG52275 [Rattus norvegicus]